MAELSWTVNVRVGGGTAMVAVADATAVEGMDTVEVSLSPGDADKVVEVQPGGADAIHLLVVKSSVYDAAFTYRASDGSSDSAVVTLDAPHVFSRGSVALFGLAPRLLKFTNTSPDKKATVLIFVARDATP